MATYQPYVPQAPSNVPLPQTAGGQQFQGPWDNSNQAWTWHTQDEWNGQTWEDEVYYYDEETGQYYTYDETTGQYYVYEHNDNNDSWDWNDHQQDTSHGYATWDERPPTAVAFPTFLVWSDYEAISFQTAQEQVHEKFSTEVNGLAVSSLAYSLNSSQDVSI